MAKKIDFKEYTRLRDIVVKRNKRAVQAGLMPAIHFPTVKEIKAGFVSASQALNAVKGYYSGGSQVRSIRQTGMKPVAINFPVMPEQPKPTIEQQKEKRRRRERFNRQKRKVLAGQLTDKQRDYYQRYLKALYSLNEIYSASGKGFALTPDMLTPTMAKSFVEYLDYRFSQGDFKMDYVIDEFMEGFSKLMKKPSYSPETLQEDFSKFLLEQHQIELNAETMEGITNDQFRSYWDEYIGE